MFVKTLAKRGMKNLGAVVVSKKEKRAKDFEKENYSLAMELKYGSRVIQKLKSHINLS